MGLGEKIRELRIKKDYTQDRLAEEIGMQRSNVAKYESNTNLPPVETLSKLADIFKVSVDYLLGRSENPHETFLPESELSPMEEIKLRNFLSKTEKMMREMSGLDEEKLNQAMHMFEFTFRDKLNHKNKK